MEALLSQHISDLIVQLAVAGGIGALIGLEREQSSSAGTFAGSRTFPIIALIGALTQALFPELLAVMVGCVTILIAIGYGGKIWFEDDIGLTTAIAAVLVLVLGSMTTLSSEGLQLAVIIGGVTTVLLSAKDEIHRFIHDVEEHERNATLKLIVISLVILPILPNQSIDALYGLNLHFIWLMVVFVTGLSFLAYILSQAYEAERGIALTGILGGFISSTATTVSMSERTKDTPDLYKITGFAILVAAAFMFPRALIEVAVIHPALLSHVAVPMAGMTITGLAIGGILYWRTELTENIEADIENPVRLKPALIFGFVFMVVLLVADTAHATAGASGIYGTAFISGLADVDAMAITLSKLAAEGSVPVGLAAEGIVIAAVSNTIVKAGIAFLLGTKKLGATVTGGLTITSIVGLVLVFAL